MTDTDTLPDTLPDTVTLAPPSVPFEDTESPSKDFEVTKPIDVSRLQAEISEALGKSVQVIVAHTDLDKPIGPKNPAKVYVSADDDFDGRTVRGVITSHEGESTESKDLTKSVDALRSGKDLSLKDLNAVVRTLIR